MNGQYFASMPERLDEYFARRLRELRGELTQEQWEERTKIPQTTLSRWESPEGWGRMKNVDERLRGAGIDPFVLVHAAPHEKRDPRIESLVRALERADEADLDILVHAIETVIRVRRSDLLEDPPVQRIGSKS